MYTRVHHYCNDHADTDCQWTREIQRRIITVVSPCCLEQRSSCDVTQTAYHRISLHLHLSEPALTARLWYIGWWYKLSKTCLSVWRWQQSSPPFSGILPSVGCFQTDNISLLCQTGSILACIPLLCHPKPIYCCIQKRGRGEYPLMWVILKCLAYIGRMSFRAKPIFSFCEWVLFYNDFSSGGWQKLAFFL